GATPTRCRAISPEPRRASRWRTPWWEAETAGIEDVLDYEPVLLDLKAREGLGVLGDEVFRSLSGAGRHVGWSGLQRGSVRAGGKGGGAGLPRRMPSGELTWAGEPRSPKIWRRDVQAIVSALR